MPERRRRLNVLLQRELNLILREFYREEAAALTVLSASVAPNLRYAKVFYSVLGEASNLAESRKFFKRARGGIQRHLGKRIVLKYMPVLEFCYDDSAERSFEVTNLLEGLS